MYVFQIDRSLQVIDSTDKIRANVVKDELEEMLEHKELAGRKIPILFFANKVRSRMHRQICATLLLPQHLARQHIAKLVNLSIIGDIFGAWSRHNRINALCAY